MKSYVKMVDAVQYTGKNLDEVKVFTGIEDLVCLDGSTQFILNEEIGKDKKTAKWLVQSGYFIVREKSKFTVYQAEKFKEEFDEVFIEEDSLTEIPVEKLIDIEVKDAEVVKKPKKGGRK